MLFRPKGSLQMRLTHPTLLGYVDHDANIRRRSATVNMVEPNGYEGFATIYNRNKGDNPCEFILRKPETGLYNYDSFPIPQSVLTFPVVDSRYSKFRAFGIIKPDGEVNQEAWASMKNALLRPHREAVRNQARSDSCREEKELKKRRFEDANADVFSLPTSSRANSNKKKRAQKDTATSESSEGDKEMPIGGHGGSAGAIVSQSGSHDLRVQGRGFDSG
ncbi:hypothetical protein E4T56_gene8455 [Termitomyces sp. T112]|nr:hypothetical protein E4T56_gene8455 [Termitomyces sp. T112]